MQQMLIGAEGERQERKSTAKAMLSEALMTTSPLLIADPGGLGPRHQSVTGSLVRAGLAARLGEALPPARAARDETGRIAAEIRARGWA